MKKLLTMTLTLIVLAAFTGLGAAQEKKGAVEERGRGREGSVELLKKPVEPAAVPYADKIMLSATTTNVISKNGCPVTARPGNSAKPADIFPGQPLDFPAGTVVSPAGPWKTGPNGTLKVTIKFGTTVQATMQTPKGTVTSNSLTCGGPLLPEK